MVLLLILGASGIVGEIVFWNVGNNVWIAGLPLPTAITIACLVVLSVPGFLYALSTYRGAGRARTHKPR
jgi:hypothetical protein